MFYEAEEGVSVLWGDFHLRPGEISAISIGKNTSFWIRCQLLAGLVPVQTNSLWIEAIGQTSEYSVSSWGHTAGDGHSGRICEGVHIESLTWTFSCHASSIPNPLDDHLV